MITAADRILQEEGLTIGYTDSWLEQLREWGVEHEGLNELAAARNEITRLTEVAAEISRTEPGAPATPPPLAAGVTAATAIKAAKRSAGATADELAAALRAVNEQVQTATNSYIYGYRAFTREYLVDALTPFHNQLTHRAAELATSMPDGLADDDEARLGDVLDEWLELGRVVDDHKLLHRLIRTLREHWYWTQEGNRREYLETEFQFRDVDTATAWLKIPGRMGYARALEHADPAILRVQQVDEIRQRTPEPQPRTEDDFYAGKRRRLAVEEWLKPARHSEEQRRMRAHEEHMATKVRERMATLT